MFDAFIGEPGLTWSGKEVKAVSELKKKLADRLTKQGAIATDERIKENFSLFLEMTQALNDNWLNNHFTPATLNSQFNNIVIHIKNGKANKASRTTGAVVTDDAVREAFSILFAEGGN